MIDGVRFDRRALFYYLNESFGLSDDAKVRNVEIYVTVDGAKLDDNSGHVTIGFKICDKRAKYKVSGKYIYANVEGEKDDEQMDNLQSGIWCFPIVSIFAKNNKEMYEKCLRPISAYCAELRTVGVPAKGCRPSLVSEPQNVNS
jgi:hypothetical protein